MRCVKLYNSANSLISLEEYCGPLSLTTVAGTPKRANTPFIAVIILAEVVDWSFCTSMYLE